MAGTDKRYIDPMFYIPEGMDSDVWTYREDLPWGDDYDVENANVVDEDGGYDGEVESDVTIVDEGNASEDDAPMVIDNLTVISQTVRRVADGSYVIDVVVDVDDIPGVTKYEFRVTKI